MNGKTEPVYTDIEIYLFKKELSDIISWLKKRFILLIHGKEVTEYSTTYHFLAKTETESIRIVIIEKILDGYSSIFFDSPDPPWQTDLDCARDAFRHFRVEVRCCANSWSAEQNPDEWLSICQEGESIMTW